MDEAKPDAVHAMLKDVSYNRYQYLFTGLGLALIVTLAVFVGCASKTDSLITPGARITREQLQVEKAVLEQEAVELEAVATNAEASMIADNAAAQSGRLNAIEHLKATLDAAIADAERQDVLDADKLAALRQSSAARVAAFRSTSTVKGTSATATLDRKDELKAGALTVAAATGRAVMDGAVEVTPGAIAGYALTSLLGLGMFRKLGLKFDNARKDKVIAAQKAATDATHTQQS